MCSWTGWLNSDRDVKRDTSQETPMKTLQLLRKLAAKKQNLDPMWKPFNKEVDLGVPTSFLDNVYLDCTQRQCELSKNTVDNLQNHVWIASFRGRGGETTIPSKFSYFFMVLWHGWSCKRNVWNDVASCRTRQHDNTTKEQHQCLA